MDYINIINTILISLIIIFSLKYKSKKECHNNELFLSNKSYNVIIIALFLVGLFIRVYKFGIIPGGFNQDEAMAAVDGFALANYGTDRFGMKYPAYFTAWDFAQMNVLESYLMIPFFKIFGMSSVSARLPMLFVNLFAIYVFFSFIKQIFGKNEGLVALAFLVINPWQIMISRWGLESNIFPNFILFSVFFLYKGLKKPIFMYISMVFFGLTMYAYGIAYYTIPLLLIILCIYLLSKKLITIKNALICFAVYIFVSLPIFGVIIINFLKMPTIETPFLTIPFFPNSIRSTDLLPYADNILRQAINNFYKSLDTVIFQFEDLPWNSIPQFGVYYLFSLPFLILGGYYVLSIYKKGKDLFEKTGCFFIVVWFFIGLYGGVMVNGVNINRINIIIYPILIFCSLGIYYLLFDKIKIFTFSVLIITMYLFSFFAFSYNYFGEYSKSILYYFYDGFGEAVKYANSTDANKIYITSKTQYDEAYQVSEILTMFHCNIDSLYFQGKKVIYDENNLELLPYKDRFNYVNFTSMPEDLSKNTVYVFNISEKAYFPKEIFDIYDFGNFLVGRANIEVTP